MASSGHSIGRQRDHNEDAHFTLSSTLAGHSTSQPFGLYIVADGMGGHQHGERASGIAVRTMADYVLEHLRTPLLSFPSKQPSESLQELMRDGLIEAHRSVVKRVPGGGTTLTAALVLGNQVTIAHAGDSRAYTILPNGHMELLTRDHSLVKRLIELNQITPEEAAVHPQRSVLYRALGQIEPIEPDIITTHFPNAGYLFLCSDGLWSIVGDKTVYSLITEAPDMPTACKRLIDAANQAGGPDNITVVLVRQIPS
jgi:protein phosphatase